MTVTKSIDVKKKEMELPGDWQLLFGVLTEFQGVSTGRNIPPAFPPDSQDHRDLLENAIAGVTLFTDLGDVYYLNAIHSMHYPPPWWSPTGLQFMEEKNFVQAFGAANVLRLAQKKNLGYVSEDFIRSLMPCLGLPPHHDLHNLIVIQESVLTTISQKTDVLRDEALLAYIYNDGDVEYAILSLTTKFIDMAFLVLYTHISWRDAMRELKKSKGNPIQAINSILGVNLR